MPKHIYDGWCDCVSSDFSKGRRIHKFSERANTRSKVHEKIVKTVLAHYEDPKFLADRVKRLGFKKASKILATFLPVSPKARSGHLGEVFATEAVPVIAPSFGVPIRRLRWLDGREMALRGEDIIAIERGQGRTRFLKGESKSRLSLTPAVVREARAALKSHNERPSQHALSFVMHRLLESGDTALAHHLEEYLLRKTIATEDMVHLIFGFSGNDATPALSDDLAAYSGKIEQHSVNFRIEDHQDFIAAIYKK